MQVIRKLTRWPAAVATVALAALSFAAVALASSVNVAVVDVTAPTNSVTLAPGQNAPITINMSVTGNQEGTATFEVYRNWTLSGGTFTGSNPQEFTVPPRSSSSPATTFSTTGTVTVAASQAPVTRTLQVGAFDITNSNDSGAKLAAGSSSNYQVTVAGSADSTPPVIGHVVNPASPNGQNGWYTSNVSLTWSVTENESPGSLSKTGCVDQNITADQAATTYSCSATSLGGSAGPVNVSLKRDATAPSVQRNTASDSCATPGVGGWCRGVQTAGFAAADAVSGLADASQSSFTKTSGTDQGETLNIASGSVSDNAGNTNPGINAGTFKIDSTRPTISSSAVKLTGGSPDGAYTADTWTNKDVRVTFACNDGGSGTSSTLTGDDVTTEGANHSVTSQGTCEDNAGNEANPSSGSFGAVKIDKTKPVVTVDTGTYTPGSWTNGNVTVTFGCAETGSVQSGIATDSVAGGGLQDAESATDAGTDVTSTGTCVDAAGNVADSETVNVKIDKTKPIISAATGGYASGSWTNQDVGVSFSCADALSGKDSDDVAGGGTYDSETAGTDVTNSGSCVDEAGNSADSKTVTVRIDKTKPLISVATGGYVPGTWTNQSVDASFSCADALSGFGTNTVGGGGLQSADSATAAGTDVTNTGTCVDRAGNTGDAKTVNVKIDKTNPVVSVTGVADGASYTLGSVPAAGCTTTDGLSGVDAPAYLQVGSGTVGAITVECLAGKDNAGNTNSASVTYNVVYAWNGFFAPIDNPSTGKMNGVKAGSAVPVKFSLGGDAGLGIFKSGSPRSGTLNCSDLDGSVSGDTPTTTAGNSTLSYDATSNQYTYVWKTDRNWSGQCRRLTLELIDGTTKTVNFKMMK